jgi:hypothetical protein
MCWAQYFPSIPQQLGNHVFATASITLLQSLSSFTSSRKSPYHNHAF